MRYIGSKWNLLSHIDGVVDNLGVKKGIFCDLFAGTANPNLPVLSKHSVMYKVIASLLIFHRTIRWLLG